FYTGEYCADYSHPTRPSPSPHQPDRTWHHPNPRCTRHGPFSSQQDCPESAENSPPGHATTPQYASSHPRPDPSDHTSASTTHVHSPQPYPSMPRKVSPRTSLPYH